MENELQVVLEHKDRVFRRVFHKKEKQLELYNALNDTFYTNPEELEVWTLENAIYMNVKNDVSFLLASELNLYEHQASFNPNMPLRDLIYIARQLEKFFLNKSIYSSKLVKIPVPRFVVFYNGGGEQPEKRVLKLSDAFEKRVDDPELELKVVMLNINYGKNKELMEKCRTLKEYSQYVARIREHAKIMPIEQAVCTAVDECIQENILRDFLQEQKAEAIAMSIFEYNAEEELKKLRAAEREGGFEDGYLAGENRGRAEGAAEGVADSILTLLEEFGEVSNDLRLRITKEKDAAKLKVWLKKAARAENIADFCKEISE